MTTVVLVSGCTALLSIWKVAYVGDKVRSPALLGRQAGGKQVSVRCPCQWWTVTRSRMGTYLDWVRREGGVRGCRAAISVALLLDAAGQQRRGSGLGHHHLDVWARRTQHLSW